MRNFFVILAAFSSFRHAILWYAFRFLNHSKVDIRRISLQLQDYYYPEHG